MHGKHSFEYAIMRIVPRVEREEFVNAGAILYCRDLKFLDCRYVLNKEKILALCADADCSEVEHYLHAFQKICVGEKDGGSIAMLDAASRFRWLTATRSSVVQCSKVHPGLCVDAVATLENLMQDFVL